MRTRDDVNPLTFFGDSVNVCCLPVVRLLLKYCTVQYICNAGDLPPGNVQTVSVLWISLGTV
jgi:hypothetical protein